MEHPKVNIEQCQIDQFQETAAEFLQVVLDMDYGKVMVTDMSDLSDFCYSGKWHDGVLDTSVPLEQMTAAWDEWAIAKVREKYGITLPSTVVNLVWLFNQIELNKKALVH
jgi:hypothetical protein